MREMIVILSIAGWVWAAVVGCLLLVRRAGASRAARHYHASTHGDAEQLDPSPPSAGGAHR